MYLLTVVAVTTEENPDHGKIGEAYVSCWINTEDELDAIEKAHALIKSDGWSIVETEEVSTVSEEDYEEDDEYLSFYQQALTDNEVVLFHISPKFPVYRMVLELSGTSDENKPCQAIAWVCNEAIDTDYDPMELDFWADDRITQALALAAETVSEHGYEVTGVSEQAPCNRDGNVDEIHYYDDAEEDGICVVLVQDEAE